MLMFGKPAHWRDVSPSGAVRDFITVWRDNPYRWRVLAVSIVLTGVMLYGFLPDSERADPRPPEITYITTFAEGRSEAEIVASNLEYQKLKERREAERAARLEQRKQRARALARASGFDPDELARQYADKPAAKAPSPAQTGGPVAGER